MKKMLKYLSPFAPDQSGACGVLYELGGIIVICDAGGCAGNICGFDEPRWFMKKSAVFSAGLRDMDAIMGRDDKLIQKLSDAQDTLKCKFTAIVATPVPAVIGTDMKALKRMAEKKTGVPCITVNAIGTKYYDEGESEAWDKLFREFAGADILDAETSTPDGTKPEPAAEASGNAKVEEVELRSLIGVIGATPLETGYSTSEPLIQGLKNYGIDEAVIYSMGTGLEEIRKAPEAKKNLVVSAAGIKAAEYLKKEFGVPYEVGYPFVPDSVVSEVKEYTESLSDEKDEKRVLIIHSQFAANEVRNIIRNVSNKENVRLSINCATFFMQDDDYKESGDIRLSGEDDLWELISEEDYDAVIADEDIKRLLTAAGFKGRFIEFPHFAISGRPLDEGRTIHELKYNS